jgi:hypothetical protein
MRLLPLTQEHFIDVLSTLRSAVFSKVVMVYQETDFRGIQVWGSPKWPYLRQVSPDDKLGEAAWHSERFQLLREARKTKVFELVLRADVWGPVAEYAVRMLEEAIPVEKVEKGFDDFSSEPLVMYNPRRGLQRVQAPRPPGLWSVCVLRFTELITCRWLTFEKNTH